ncbi:MAG: FAD binding domain-containing protein [Candidatus Kapabacteria bacterium]|nr:FAD binding domain-containing protein [Candidatus Kapabacteria bacterium]
MIPAYFLDIPDRLQRLVEQETLSNGSIHALDGHEFTISGGTDLFVQKHESLVKSRVRLLGAGVKSIPIPYEEDGYCILDARTPVSAVLESQLINRHIPQMPSFLRLFASTPIRNRATLGGNINNASPIGDMTAILLALDAELTLRNSFEEQRVVMLKHYFKGYKTLDRKPDETVRSIRFLLPNAQTEFKTLFNYEKVSRRTYLDIASVNTALQLRLEGDTIFSAHASAGGVAPIPLYLAQTSSFLAGKTISEETFREAASIAVSETSPISDARGTAEYKRLLLRQLFFAHALDLFPERLKPQELLEME